MNYYTLCLKVVYQVGLEGAVGVFFYKQGILLPVNKYGMGMTEDTS